MSKPIDMAEHNSAKLKLLNANKGILVDSSGAPIAVMNVVEEPEPMRIDMRMTPTKYRGAVIEQALIDYLLSVDIVEEKDGEYSNKLSYAEMSKRGKWLTGTDPSWPVTFQFDGVAVIHFIY